MSDEMYGFVFAVTFILIFATLVGTIPSGLQGEDETPNNIGGISGSLLGDFADYTNWTTASYNSAPVNEYDYDFNSLHWLALYAPTTTNIIIGVKDYIGGLIWLGTIYYMDFQAPDGSLRGNSLTLATITSDSEDGSVTYSMTFGKNAKSAGSLVIGWNTTLYDNATAAWDADDLHFVHGIGFANKASNNILSLVVGLLTFSVPNVPVMIGIFLAAPVWTCIFFVLFYLITKLIPFVG